MKLMNEKLHRLYDETEFRIYDLVARRVWKQVNEIFGPLNNTRFRFIENMKNQIEEELK
jgi:hypothetical protein